MHYFLLVSLVFALLATRCTSDKDANENENVRREKCGAGDWLMLSGSNSLIVLFMCLSFSSSFLFLYVL